MFSFFLNFHVYFEKLKKQKGIWFTMMTVASILGIVGSLYYMTSVTNRTAVRMYESTHEAYISNIDDTINTRVLYLQTVYSLLVNNTTFTNSFNNQTDANGIANALRNASVIVNQNGDKNASGAKSSDVIFDFYSDSLVLIASSNPNQKITGAASDLKGISVVSKTKAPIAGLELQDGTVYIRYLTPLRAGGKDSGYLQLKTKFEFVAERYGKMKQSAQVIFLKDFMDMKKIQDYKFQAVGKSLISVQANPDTSFLDALSQVDYDELTKKQYVIDKGYFIAFEPLNDAAGSPVGAILVGEEIMKDGSLPKMAKGVSNGVTVAAIGLVVALLVLMI